MRISHLFVGLSLALSAACSSNKQPTPEPTPEPAPEPAEPDPAATPDLPPDPAPTAAAITAAEVIGSWKTTGTDFEELGIEEGGTWSSFLHGRPMYSGKWKLEGNKLTLESDTGETPMVMSGLERDGDKLSGTLDGKAVSWTRIDTGG